MNPRAVAIIRRNRTILLIHRVNDGRDYWVLPGGSIEPGESANDACCREVQEETGLDVTFLEIVASLVNDGRRETYFAVTVAEGEPVLGGPEKERESAANQYRLQWVTREEFDEADLRPTEARDVVLAHFTEV